MMKMFSKLEIAGNFLSLIKNVYRKPIAIIILNGERQCFLRKEHRKDLHSQLLFNTLLQVVGERERGGGRKWKERRKES